MTDAQHFDRLVRERDAFEKRVRELDAALNAAAYALFQIKRMVPEYVIEHSKKAYDAACVVLNGESTLETEGDDSGR